MKLKRKIALLFASISIFSLGVGESINATDDLIKIYQGDFVDGKSTGKGIYTWANGDKYEGDFVDGKSTGKGIILGQMEINMKEIGLMVTELAKVLLIG